MTVKSMVHRTHMKLQTDLAAFELSVKNTKRTLKRTSFSFIHLNLLSHGYVRVSSNVVIDLIICHTLPELCAVVNEMYARAYKGEGDEVPEDLVAIVNSLSATGEGEIGFNRSLY